MILALIPTKPNLSKTLFHVSLKAEMEMKLACKDKIEVVRDISGIGDADVLGAQNNKVRVDRIVEARNSLISRFLKPYHTHVLWIDADIVYSPDIVLYLLDTQKHAIVAPLVMLEDYNRFYDTFGFIKNGKYANYKRPYFNERPGEKIVNMDSVGAFFLVPADIHRSGGKFAPMSKYTEHYALCCFAKQLGYSVICNTELSVYHVNLAKYGESWH